MKVGGHTLDDRALRPGLEAMRPAEGIDYFESWAVEKALLPACRRRGLNATYVAGRLLQRERKAGRIRHRGRGQWIPCDSGRLPQGEDSRSEAECEASQSGAAKTAHRPNPESILQEKDHG